MFDDIWILLHKNLDSTSEYFLKGRTKNFLTFIFYVSNFECWQGKANAEGVCLLSPLPVLDGEIGPISDRQIQSLGELVVRSKNKVHPVTSIQSSDTFFCFEKGKCTSKVII